MDRVASRTTHGVEGALDPRVRPSAEGYLHDVLIHSTEEELADVAVPFLRGGLEADEVVLVLAGDRVRDVLMSLMPGHPRIQMRAPQVPYENPARTAARFHQFFRENLALGAKGFRVLSEMTVGPDPVLLQEWARYEAVVNEVFAPYRTWSLCTVDARVNSPAALRMAELTHPHRVGPGRREVNRNYADPGDLVSALPSAEVPDPLESGPPTVVVENLTSVRELRPEIRGAADVSGLSWAEADEFMLAVSEVAVNALVHGQAPVTVRAWAAPGRVVATVTDHGRGFDDPYIGFRSVYSGGTERDGAGLTLVRQLCDQVHFGHTPDGFRVRLTRNR